jgi:periplasmic divalent cation tolerance protein
VSIAGKERWNRLKNRSVQLKRRSRCINSLNKLIQEVHSYDVPEILATEIVGGLQSYEDWITQETEGQEKTRIEG